MSSQLLEIKSRRLLAEAYVREASLLECGAGPPREEQLRRVESTERALRRGLDVGSSRVRTGIFTRILVATDGSAEAQRAERLGAGIAAEGGGELLLVSVADTRWTHGPDEIAYTELQLRGALREKVDQYLAEASSRVPAGVRVELSRREGEPATQILEGALEWGPDLIVMGTRGRGRLRGRSSHDGRGGGRRRGRPAAGRAERSQQQSTHAGMLVATADRGESPHVAR